MDALVKLEGARRMLAECRTLKEVKRIQDIAKAATIYAKAAHLSRDAQNYAAEITLLAARKAGEILKDLAKKSKAGRPEKIGAATAPISTPYQDALRESDTPRRTAADWQKLAEVPQATVERYVAETKAGQGEITQAGLRRAHAKEDPKPAKKQQTADDRWRQVYAFIGNLYGGLPREQRRQELREVGRKLIEAQG